MSRPMSTVEVQDLARSANPLATQASEMSVSVRVLRSVSEIEELRDVWAQMQRHPNADIDFYLTVLQSLPGLIRPHVLVVERDATPVAILVGRLENARIDFKIGYKDFWRPRVRALTFIYGGLMGNPCSHICEVLVREIMQSLHEGEADLAFFNHLRADSPMFAALGHLPGVISRDHFPTSQIHRRMTLPDNAEDFWRRLSPRVRKNQHWQAKKLISSYSGNVRIQCFRERSDLERTVQDVEQVARKTYQRGLGVGFADTAVMRQRLSLRAEKGCLRAYILYIDDTPCAFWLGTVYDREFHSDFMGYDPAYSKYSPGMYLITKVIEDLSQRGGEERDICGIDFGLGDAGYKDILSDVQWQDVSFYLFGVTVRGLAVQAVRIPTALIDRAARAMLGQSRLFLKIKKLWRSRAALSANTN